MNWAPGFPDLMNMMMAKLDGDPLEPVDFPVQPSPGPVGVRWQGIGSCMSRWSRVHRHMILEVKNMDGELAGQALLRTGDRANIDWERSRNLLVIWAYDVHGLKVKWWPSGLQEITLPIVLTGLT